MNKKAPKSIPDQIMTMLRRSQRRRPITAGEVCERLDIGSSQATVALKRLVDRGHLVREVIEITKPNPTGPKGGTRTHVGYGYTVPRP